MGIKAVKNILRESGFKEEDLDLLTKKLIDSGIIGDRYTRRPVSLETQPRRIPKGMSLTFRNTLYRDENRLY